MPAPLAVDKDAVKAHALQHGAREAARAFGLSEGTVTAWSMRYGWMKPVEQQLPATVKPRVVNAVRTPSEAAKSTMDRLNGRTRVGLARGLAKGAGHVAKMSGETVLAKAGQIRDLTTAAAKVHGWEDGGGSVRLRLDLLAGTRSEGPVIEVEAEVRPDDA